MILLISKIEYNQWIDMDKYSFKLNDTQNAFEFSLQNLLTWFFIHTYVPVDSLALRKNACVNNHYTEIGKSGTPPLI